MAIITFNDIHGVEQTLDTEQKFNIAWNADCMDLLRAMPDNCVDLAVCDPPYGDALQTEDIEHRNQRGCFDRYNDSSQVVNVERERERIIPTYNRFGSPGSRFERYKTNVVSDSTEAERKTHGESISQSEAKVSRTGGTWAEKYGKKS